MINDILRCERNPGPLTAEQQREFLEALCVIPKIQEGQLKVLSDLREIKRNQQVADEKLAALTARIAWVAKGGGKGVKEIGTEISCLKEQNEANSAQLHAVMTQQDDLTNKYQKMFRFNFFRWAARFCQQNVGRILTK